MKIGTSKIEITLYVYVNLLCLLIITFTFASIRISLERFVKQDLIQQVKKITNYKRNSRQIGRFNHLPGMDREILKNRNIRILSVGSPEYRKLVKEIGEAKRFDPENAERSIVRRKDRFMLYATFTIRDKEEVIVIWSEPFKIPLIPAPSLMLLIFIVNIANFFVVLYIRKNFHQVEEKNDDKHQIASNIAHELKNPLAGISLFAELLERKIDTEPEKEYILNIRKQVRNLNKIISNFINFARPFSLNIQKIMIGDIFKKLLKELEYDLKGIDVTFDINEKKGLRGDGVLLKQVFNNLLLNAIESFEEQKDKYIRICIKESGNYTVVYIENNGSAIEETDKGRIFKPYFTSKIKGSGLGLAISAKILKKHKSTIELISSDKDKTIFKIRLWRKL